MTSAIKDLYTKEYLEPFTSEFKKCNPSFDTETFYSLVFDDHWSSLELKQRIRHITLSLEKVARSYEETISYLMEIAPKCAGHGYLFFPDYVEVFGFSNWELSIKALKKITPYFTCEFAVRPYIEENPTKMMSILLEWSKDANEHVRRLASEGSRPRLPWAKPLAFLKIDPSPALPILEELKRDESLYVRKSVANHLNDISKDHPKLVLELCQAWKNEHKHTDWIMKHGCRTLLKQGNSEALSLFGFEDNPAIQLLSFQMDQKVSIGDRLSFSFTFENISTSPTKLRIEYKIDYLKKHGKHSKKVFQLTEKTFPTGIHSYQRNHSFIDLSTRIHYRGEHYLSLIINGQVVKHSSFFVS
ncbi:DNA alkylation repair protein [Alkalihalobacillus trypoxylicola]|uniref:DNA alkylation repair protein n=1 Tax=Alkalihalobacillus trypoxylicola TaxID=519424 RepID=A0A162F2B3_9BACI|nr:DNA alkylation repair protein [Alkalihalobacillus trypoxylicola]KYG34332.1 DNA alkylation repair protein [Alkalihalobacillus trypoxylicola]